MARDKETLQQLGITHILNVTLPRDEGGVHNFFEDQPPFVYARCPVQDSDGADIMPFFDQSFLFIEEAISQNHSVLVHCQQGISRSATIVVAYLMRKHNLNLQTAYVMVKQARPVVKPKPNFLKQLLAFEKKLLKAQQAQQSVKSDVISTSSISTSTSTSTPISNSSSTVSSPSSSPSPIGPAVETASNHTTEDQREGSEHNSSAGQSLLGKSSFRDIQTSATISQCVVESKSKSSLHPQSSSHQPEQPLTSHKKRKEPAPSPDLHSNTTKTTSPSPSVADAVATTVSTSSTASADKPRKGPSLPPSSSSSSPSSSSSSSASVSSSAPKKRTVGPALPPHLAAR